MVPQTIYIGHLGEANSRHYDIDISDLQAVASGCTPVLYVKRNGDTDAYPATTTLTGNVLRWTFSAVDTAKLGFGECQVVMCNSAGTIIAKSNLIRICCKQSLTTTSTVPDAWAPWVAQVSTLKAQIDAKGASIDSAVASGLASIATKKDEALDALGVKYNEIYQVATSAMAGITLGGNEQINAVKAEGTTQKSDIDAKTAEFKTYLSEQKEDIVTSAQTATQAKNDAISAKNEAQTVANTALTDINNAKENAETAIENARDNAVSAVNTATEGAVNAKELAISARNDAVSAKESALSAKADALTAKQQAESAVASVNKVNATVSKTGDTAIITTVDRDGVTKTATVSDGEKFPSVASLDADTDLVCGKIIETVGIPKYVGESEFANYSTFGITETGWYVFARITAKQGVTVASGFSVTGATKYITPSVGGNYVDIAVRFGVASESKKVVVNWGVVEDVYVFKSTDLAVRNLDYRTTFYVYDIAPYTTETDSKITFSGMVHNVTYKHTGKINKPIEIVLPTIDTTDGHGVWMEIQLLFGAVYSCTLTTSDNTAVIKNTASPTIKKGYNVLDLMYYDIDGVKAWRVQNTTSDIT